MSSSGRERPINPQISSFKSLKHKSDILEQITPPGINVTPHRYRKNFMLVTHKRRNDPFIVIDANGCLIHPHA